MGYLNSKIGTTGREVVLAHLKTQGIEPDAASVIKAANGKKYYLVISTKRHGEIEGSKCTGLNSGRIVTIQQKVKKLKVDGAYLVFVDAKLGLCYGGYLETLLQKKEFDGIEWPFQSTSQHGVISFFSVFHMKTLFTLSPATVQKLNELGSDNKRNKDQLKLL